MATLFSGKTVSAAYARHRYQVPAVILDKILEQFTKQQPLEKCLTVVDVGCGPGDNTAIVCWGI